VENFIPQYTALAATRAHNAKVAPATVHLLCILLTMRRLSLKRIANPSI
jgi:hypothetical protein